MKKRNKILKIIGMILIITIAIVGVTTLNNDVFADVGNNNRYPTSDYGGSSDFGGSDFAIDGDIFFLIYMIFDTFGFTGGIIAIIVIFAFYKFNKYTNSKNKQNVRRNTMQQQVRRTPEKKGSSYSNRLAVEAVTTIDPNFSESVFLGWSKEVFLKIQEAWTKREWKTIRPFESNELFSQHSTQLEEYIRKGQINVVERINISDARIKDFVQRGSNEIMTVDLFAVMRDYVINENDKKVVEGDQLKDWNMHYELTFVRTSGVKTKIDEKNSTTNCPNCGAPTKITSSGQCEYCDSVITTGEYGWVLSAIKTL